jgi:ankyrin repeat protein
LDALSIEKRGEILQTVDLDGLTPLDHAEANSRIRAATTLVRNGAMRGGEDVMAGAHAAGACPGAAVDAVLLGQVGDLEELFKASDGYFSMSVGDCILSLNPREWSLLHLATAVAAVSSVPRDSFLEVVKQLLAHGIDATREDAFGQTPLYFAVKAGRSDLVQLLLDSAPREVNHLDRQDQTPLLYAAMTGNEEVAKLLLAKGADAQHPDRDGLSARDWAVENGHESVIAALSEGPRGVRGSSGKSALPRRTVHGMPVQELWIIAVILSVIIWLRTIANGTCMHPKFRWRCKRAEPVVDESCS